MTLKLNGNGIIENRVPESGSVVQEVINMSDANWEFSGGVVQNLNPLYQLSITPQYADSIIKFEVVLGYVGINAGSGSLQFGIWDVDNNTPLNRFNFTSSTSTDWQCANMYTQDDLTTTSISYNNMKVAGTTSTLTFGICGRDEASVDGFINRNWDGGGTAQNAGIMSFTIKEIKA